MCVTLRNLIHPPRLWPSDPSGAGRRVTWLELFFDLIFVAAVAQVGTPLTDRYELQELGRYVFMFILIWWAWLGHTMYSTRFDSDDLIQRVLTLLQIFAAAIMAANAKDSLDSRNSAGFGAAYAGMRLVLVFQYLRARSLEQSRDLTTHSAIGYGMAAILWVAAALAPGELRFVLWGAALLIDIGTPLVSFKHDERFPPDAAHLPERFGLFTIILLGESVTAVMKGIESQETWTPAAAITAFSGLTFVFVLWWWYFDGVRGAADRHICSKTDARRFEIWSYAHLPLYLGIGIVGVGVEHLIALAGGSHLHGAELWIFGGGMSVLMASLILIGSTATRVYRPRHFVPVALLLSLLLTIITFGEQISPPLLMMACTAVAAIQLALALRPGPRIPLPTRELVPDFRA
jgi:low temperature requirement protein LtrA